MHEAYRLQGVARQLVETLKMIAITKGIPVMYVGTEPDNLPAKRLYSRTGGAEEQVAWYVYGLDGKLGA